MQNWLFNFQSFSFQSFNFQFCHFNPLTFNCCQFNTPLNPSYVMPLIKLKRRRFIFFFFFYLELKDILKKTDIKKKGKKKRKRKRKHLLGKNRESFHTQIPNLESLGKRLHWDSLSSSQTKLFLLLLYCFKTLNNYLIDLNTIFFTVSKHLFNWSEHHRGGWNAVIRLVFNIFIVVLCSQVEYQWWVGFEFGGGCISISFDFVFVFDVFGATTRVCKPTDISTEER